jgi:hypothetical protein
MPMNVKIIVKSAKEIIPVRIDASGKFQTELLKGLKEKEK